MATTKELANMIELKQFIEKFSKKVQEKLDTNDNDFKKGLGEVLGIDFKSVDSYIKIKENVENKVGIDQKIDDGKDSGIVYTSPIGIDDKEKKDIINVLKKCIKYIESLNLDDFKTCKIPKDIIKKACDSVKNGLDFELNPDTLEQELKSKQINSNFKNDMVKYAGIAISALMFMAIKHFCK